MFSNKKNDNASFKLSHSFEQIELPLEEKQNLKKATVKFPEKIIFVIDTVQESASTDFKLGTGIKYNSLNMVKRILEIFIQNKLMLNKKHEFAVMILDSQEIHWLCDFTNHQNIQTLLNIIESIDIRSIEKGQKYFDIQNVFNFVNSQVIEKASLLEENIVRIILLYSRSNVIPKFNITQKSVQNLIKNPNFFLDILYIHEPLCSNYKCEEIYTELTKLDIKNVSYIMEVSRSAVKIHNYMARLLAHPIQRVPQKDIKSSIHPLILKEIEENNCKSNK